MYTHFLPFSGHTCALQGSRLTVTYDNASFSYLLDAQLQCMKYFRTFLNQHTGTSQYLLCLVSPSLIYPRNSREGIIFNDTVIFPECIDFSYLTIVIVTLLKKKLSKFRIFIIIWVFSIHLHQFLTPHIWNANTGNIFENLVGYTFAVGDICFP